MCRPSRSGRSWRRWAGSLAEVLSDPVFVARTLFVARELAPAGLRSTPKACRRRVPARPREPGFGSAAQPSGSKPPRHGCQHFQTQASAFQAKHQHFKPSISTQPERTQTNTPRPSRGVFVCVGSAQVLAEQCVVQLAVAQDPDDFLVIVKHQFVAGLVADLQGVAHADIGIHQGRPPAQLFH